MIFILFISLLSLADFIRWNLSFPFLLMSSALMWVGNLVTTTWRAEARCSSVVLFVGRTQKLVCLEPCVRASRRSSSVLQWRRYVPALVLVTLILSGIFITFRSSVGEAILSTSGPSITRGGILVGRCVWLVRHC